MYGSVKIEGEIIVVQTYSEKETRISYRGNKKGFNKWKSNILKDYKYIISGEMHDLQRLLYEKSISSINNIKF